MYWYIFFRKRTKKYAFIKEQKFPPNIQISRLKYIFVHQKSWKFAFKIGFSVHNIHLYLCWQLENTKWILCCRKTGVKCAYLRFWCTICIYHLFRNKSDVKIKLGISLCSFIVCSTRTDIKYLKFARCEL